MLYGISLLAGKFGTAYLPDPAHAVTIQALGGGGTDALVVLGALFLLIGLGFKLAAVPFHFWCPDVFEGASAEVAGFLSVASKGAALAMLARITLVLGGLDPQVGPPGQAQWINVVRYFVPALAFFAALTDVGYRGPVCIEVEDRAYEGSLGDRQRALRQSKWAAAIVAAAVVVVRLGVSVIFDRSPALIGREMLALHQGPDDCRDRARAGGDGRVPGHHHSLSGCGDGSVGQPELVVEAEARGPDVAHRTTISTLPWSLRTSVW